MNLWEIIYLIEYICWILAAVAVSYPLYSRWLHYANGIPLSGSPEKRRFAIIFPAYRKTGHRSVIARF